MNKTLVTKVKKNILRETYAFYLGDLKFKSRYWIGYWDLDIIQVLQSEDRSAFGLQHHFFRADIKKYT